MKNLNYFKIGASAYVLFGMIHLLSQISTGKLNENVLQALEIMRNTSIDFMGQHSLMQFYTGFSIIMGVMLFAFGLLVPVIRNLMFYYQPFYL